MAKSKSHESVVPTRGAMARIARQTQRLERGPFNPGPGRRQPPINDGGAGVIPAQVNSGGIAAGNMSTPTSGNITLLKTSGSGAALTPSGSPVTGYNVYTTAVPGSALVWVSLLRGRYYIVAGNCSASA